MKKLLLTGFEPFLSFTLNPTERIATELHGKTIGEYLIQSEVLPVDFASASKRLLEHIQTYNPDTVISLGLAGGRYKVTPERIAINVNDGADDNKGAKKMDEPILAAGPAAYMTTLPIRQMVDQLVEAGYPAEVSNSAGTYLCNNVMYTALDYASRSEKDIPAGFIHIPASHELAIQHGKIPSWSHEDLKNAVIVCIESLNDF